MSDSDFLIPSILRDFRPWPDPVVQDGEEGLLTELGLDTDIHGKAKLSELLSRLLDVLEPALLLLNLAGYTASKAILAAKDSSLAVVVSLDSELIVSSLDVTGLSGLILSGLASSGAIVAIETSRRVTNVISLSSLQENWLTFPMDDTSSDPKDLPTILDQLDDPLDRVNNIILDEIAESISGKSVAELAASPSVASGLISIYDPSGWRLPSVEDENTDALETGDPDAVAIGDLASDMVTRIDSEGIRSFLAAEIGQEGPPLTLHARYASEDNNILRSGMKGARHRYQQVGLTGNRNNFRRSQARVITYTQFVIGCQVEGVISALGTRILLNGVSGELGSQYAIARFPFPREPVSSFTVRVDPAEGAGKLSLRFRRWGDEKAVISNVQDTDVTFSDGELPFPLQIVDGNETQPTLSVLKIVIDPTLEPEGQTSLTLSGVQHGDVLILEETSSGATVSLAVVKNFSSNDLQRLHNAGFDLSIAEPFDVSAKCSGALIAVAKFILDVEAGSSQSAQREAFLVSMRDKFSEGDLDSSKAFPCALEIPSAFGIGMFPDDASHFHLASSVEQSDDLLKSIEAVQSSILAAADAKGLSHFTDPSAESSSYRNSCQEHHDETSATLAEMLTLATDAGHGIHIWHSYERVSTLYADPVGQKPLWPGDPIRNIMCSVDGNPELFEPPDLGAAAWGEMFSDVFNEIGLFVDRRARIVPYYFSSRPDSESLESDVSYNEALQVADAVAALEDGGSVPPDASL